MSETTNSPVPPKVFFSYSHDDKDHKAWVTLLATQLREKGVDVILDQWDTEPGDDLSKFMESGVRDSDRVVMICTEKYVRKVNDGKGGAGYEAMIVSGELIEDQGRRKFIPVVRQTVEKRVIPTALSTRKYIDLSVDVEDVESGFLELLESIHQVVKHKKPPLGVNPYGDSVPRVNRPFANAASPATVQPKSAEDVYESALQLSRTQDRLGWKKLLQSALRDSERGLLEWKKENQKNCPDLYENAPLPWWEYFGEGISSYDPVLACLIAAAESSDPQISNQLGWIDRVLEPGGWEISGPTVWTRLPRAVLFYLQSYFGAMLMRSEGAAQAVNLAMTSIKSPWDDSDAIPLFLSTDVSGWIETFGGKCTLSWNFLGAVTDKKQWLIDAFGSEDAIESGRSAYYMLLSFLEFAKDAAKGDWDIVPSQVQFEVCHMFARADGRIQKEGLGYLVENKQTFLKILETNGISQDQFTLWWPKWISGMKHWNRKLGDGYFRMASVFPFERLPSELFKSPFDLKGI